MGWGDNGCGQASPPEGQGFVAIAAGMDHSLALWSDGSIVGWGDNEYGQASPPSSNDFEAIAAGYWHSLAIKRVLPPLEVSMKIMPQTLNTRSGGKWVKAHLVLPEGFEVNDVDVNMPVKVTEPFEPDIESDYVNIFINEVNLVEIEAAFERAAFCGAATGDEVMDVKVMGLLTSGQFFYGTDTIRIITKQPK